MATIVTRAGKGAPLTNAELDANFDNLNTDTESRLSRSGGTMTGVIEMGTNKITGLGNPTLAQDAVTKFYLDDVIGDIDTILDDINGEVV